MQKTVFDVSFRR